jgi:cytochrome c553
MILPARCIAFGTTANSVRQRQALAPRLMAAPLLKRTVQADHRYMPPRGHALTVLAVGLFVVTMLAAGDGRKAGDFAAGRQKALMCQTCHGLDGRAKIPEAPSLAGQSAVYLTKALNDYRSGARKNDMMSLVAPILKDKDVDDLAACYSAIEVTVSPPPR